MRRRQFGLLLPSRARPAHVRRPPHARTHDHRRSARVRRREAHARTQPHVRHHRDHVLLQRVPHLHHPIRFRRHDLPPVQAPVHAQHRGALALVVVASKLARRRSRVPAPNHDRPARRPARQHRPPSIPRAARRALARQPVLDHLPHPARVRRCESCRRQSSLALAPRALDAPRASSRAARRASRSARARSRTHARTRETSRARVARSRRRASTNAAHRVRVARPTRRRARHTPTRARAAAMSARAPTDARIRAGRQRRKRKLALDDATRANARVRTDIDESVAFRALRDVERALDVACARWRSAERESAGARRARGGERGTATVRVYVFHTQRGRRDVRAARRRTTRRRETRRRRSGRLERWRMDAR